MLDSRGRGQVLRRSSRTLNRGTVKVRPPAVAGLFYPADPPTLRRTVAGFLAEAPATDEAPKAIIAPHAGYAYSGPIAGTAYAQLLPAAEQLRRVVLLGPAHRVPIRGLAVPSVDAFMTPLGLVPIDTDAVAALRELPFVVVSDAAHREEHAIEVQLPFLQQLASDFAIVPIVVGAAKPEEVAAALDRVWGGDETRIVVSSDLSHYHDYATARRLDAQTTEAIEAMAPERFHRDAACGRLPIAGLLQAAKRRGMHARTLDLRNSGDTAGRRDQVVGYGAYAVA